MDEQQFNQLISVLSQQAIALDRIANALEINQPEKKAPNYQYPLVNFKEFDWASIGAKVIKSDQYGAAIVEWQDRQYIRRSPSNAYNTAIYFSRCIGKKEDGSNKYERLIIFKEMDQKVRPISREAEEMLG